MQFLVLLLITIGNLHTDAGNKWLPEKILQIKVDDAGTVSAGRDTINTDNLARYVQERLFKSYTGTGEMHSKIKLAKAGSHVPDIVIEVVSKEILQGQQRALTDLCLLKYKSLFNDIEKRKQDKIKKQFPVLFQTDYQ